MRVTIQSGIDARQFQTLMLQLAQAGAEADAHAQRELYQKRLALMGKRMELPKKTQGSLFGEGE